uniref:Protein CLAVATA 3 n=1 Tax=Cucumis melo TaxID=3656 RepID=A0A9I9CXP1_CUCME
MGRSSFLSILLLLLSFLFALGFSNGFVFCCKSEGFGRRNLRMVVEPLDSHHNSRLLLEENGRKWRMVMMETMDYADPEPNTNVRGGYASPPPPNHG